MIFNPKSIPDEFIQRLRSANRVVILSGAGMSAKSGIPTFREAQTGLWSKFDPKELATPEAFLQNPQVVWDWYEWRKELMSNVAPNAGHRALAEMERFISQITIITQNIDGLHQQAGSRNVIELHGNIARTKCFNEEIIVENWEDTEEKPPRCPHCGGYLRPDVVWFGENLPPLALQKAREASRSADVFLTIGTSGIVYPAAWLPMEAIEAGGLAVEINPEPTPLTTWMNHTLRGPSGVVLPALLAAAWPSSRYHKHT